MQESYPDHTQPSIQFANQQYQQVQPPMMLCPVGMQFVYEPQMVVPPDEPAQPTPNQSFQNQAFLLNVQNTPPWIQNRPNVVYMPQVQMTNNIQPYIQQQMVQNPMYNYQYQPMIMQEQIRHIVPNYMNPNMIQNPQMVHNVIQNPQNVIQNPQNPIVQQQMMNTQNIIQSPVRFQQIEQKRESPLLTQMLQSHVRKSTPNQNEFVSPMHIIRPQYVQSTVRPQMIIVNPISTNHTCTHHQQKEPVPPVPPPVPPPAPPPVLPPVAPKEPIKHETPQKHEVPQHIRNQIPEGLSVKTVKGPTTALVKPTDYALQNIAPADEAHPRVYPKPVVKPVSNRDPQTNYKRKIREISEQNSKDQSEIQVFKRNCLVNKQEAANKTTKMKIYFDVPAQNNLSTAAQNERLHNMQNGFTVCGLSRPQIEEKLLRNTVYVQARGRVNEMIVNEIQNASVSINQSVPDTNNANQSQNNIENVVNETQHTTLHTPTGSAESNVLPVPTGDEVENEIETERNVKAEQLVPVNSSVQEREDSSVTKNKSQDDEIKNAQTALSKDDDTVTQIISKVSKNIPSNDGAATQSGSKTDQNIPNGLKTNQNIALNNDDTKTQSNSKICLLLLAIKADEKKNNANKTQIVPPKDTDGIKNNAKANKTPLTNNFDDSKTKTKSKMTRMSLSASLDAENNNTKSHKNSKIIHEIEKHKKAETKKLVDEKHMEKPPIKQYVLTHVLDGHIIQESNVPFVVQKPTISPLKALRTIIKEAEPEAGPSSDKETESFENIEDEKTLNNEQTEISTDNAETETAADTIKETSETKNNRKSNTVKETSVSMNENEREVDTMIETSESTNERIVDTVTENSETMDKIEADTMTDTTETINESEAHTVKETSKPTNERETDEETNLDSPDSKTGNDDNEDDPFANLTRDTVKSWTVYDLTSHLMQHQYWEESAQKLRDEEIDGESLFLVNNDQLRQIGICEEHAQTITQFLERE